MHFCKGCYSPTPQNGRLSNMQISWSHEDPHGEMLSCAFACTAGHIMERKKQPRDKQSVEKHTGGFITQDKNRLMEAEDVWK